MANTLERVLDSLQSLNKRLDTLQAKEAAARADSEAAARRARAQREFEGRLARQSAYSSLQSRIDSILQAYNQRAPAPDADETARHYRLRLWGMLQAQLPPNSTKEVILDGGSKAVVGELATFPLSRCDDDVGNIIGPQIEQAARLMAFDPESTRDGEIKARVRPGGAGHSITEFVGKRSFTDEFAAVNRKAKVADPFRLGMISRGFPVGDM